MITRHALLLPFLLAPLAGADDLSALDALPAPFSDAKVGEKATYLYQERMEIRNPRWPTTMPEDEAYEISWEIKEVEVGRITCQVRNPRCGGYTREIDPSISFRDYLASTYLPSDGPFGSVEVGRARRRIGGRAVVVYRIRIRSEDGSGEVIIDYAPEAPIDGILHYIWQTTRECDTGNGTELFTREMTMIGS
jgi:hypothetical protein